MLRQLEQLIQGYELWQVLVELAVIWACVYLVFRFLQGTRGEGVIKGLAIVLVVATVAILGLSRGTDVFTQLNFIYKRFLGLLAVLLIVVFQPELRQAMVRLGHARLLQWGRTDRESIIDAVARAVQFLSKNQFGALIAIERNSQLGGLTDSGVQLDAKVGARLLESIFWPNSPLHDLGVVIRGDRIVAASVQFPLSEEGVLGPQFGSRHRAAAGLTLESDCLVIVVSEETGAVSLAEHGRLEHDMPREDVAAVLAARLESTAAAHDEESDTSPDAPSNESDPDEKQAA